MATARPTTRPRPGDQLELRVDDLAFGGAGVARLEGYVVFVNGGVPGDLVRAEVVKSKRAYAQARAVEVLEEGPERIAPAAPGHPGAPWQVLPYERQLEVKQAQVDDALRRIGGLDGYDLEPIVAAQETWRYRNKVEYSFGLDDAGELVCGFHAPGRFDRIEAMADDRLASEAVNALRERVVAWCRAEGLSAYDRRAHQGLLRNLVVRESRRGGALQARLVTSPGDVRIDELARTAGADGFAWTRTEGLGETTAGGETELVAGDEYLEEELGGLRLRISPEAFFQTNTEMAERLYAVAGEYAALQGWERVYDLFCGIGTVGLTLAPRAGELWGLEIVEAAVADAIENARRNEIEHARFFAGDVRLALRELVEKAGRPDVLVVDPPRAGLSQKVVRRVIETAPKRIVYVSCNPTTLAPNAAQLAEAGWALRRVRPVDMFPQTPHIECVALLERTS
ncbi:MAG: rRNA (uracil1939-C5)-methyltransferase [Solirubrobacteraceae bacterium]|jgi:23S rRNA (uracil1939-C5)-methyltransferase|nr:rRNA (uracil1939-C5)-methyltransferase [Solirubrobacteraceae bacterium]